MNEYENKGRQGILYLCATPIGNLEDIIELSEFEVK